MTATEHGSSATAPQINPVLDAAMTVLLTRIRDRLRNYSSKFPKDLISTTTPATDERPLGTSKANELEIANLYTTGTLMNKDLQHSEVFIRSTTTYMADLLSDVLRQTASSTPSITFFLLRTYLETWAVLLDGLKTIQNNVNPRPNLQDWIDSATTTHERLQLFERLNFSSFSDKSLFTTDSNSIRRAPDDQFRSKNVVTIMQKYDHMVPGYERLYDILSHFIHPSSAIREIYLDSRQADLTETQGISIFRVNSLEHYPDAHRRKLLDLDYRENSVEVSRRFQKVFSECDQTQQQFEQNATSELRKASKKQRKLNNSIASLLVNRLSTSPAQCFCGSSRVISKCCAH